MSGVRVPGVEVKGVWCWGEKVSGVGVKECLVLGVKECLVLE